MSIWRAIRTAFAWREAYRTNHISYQENAVTGERRAVRFNYVRGWPAPPNNQDWLNRWPEGESRRRMGAPPRPER